MGWHGYGSEAADLEIEGEVTVQWTCPRCDFRNTNKIQAANLLFGGDQLYCQNIEVCGLNQSYINLPNGDVSCKCTNSRPLNSP